MAPRYYASVRSVGPPMLATPSRLFQCAGSLRVALTLFTKDNCQLCTNARAVLDKTLAADQFRDINLTVVDIMKPENEEAYDKYCYDVPVLHVDRPGQKKPIKFMHYFDQDSLAAEFGRS